VAGKKSGIYHFTMHDKVSKITGENGYDVWRKSPNTLVWRFEAAVSWRRYPDSCWKRVPIEKYH